MVERKVANKEAEDVVLSDQVHNSVLLQLVVNNQKKKFQCAGVWKKKEMRHNSVLLRVVGSATVKVCSKVQQNVFSVTHHGL